MTPRASLPLYALLLLLAGCATRVSEPVNMGQGIYMMLASTSNLTANTHEVVSDVQRHAADFCASSGGKALEVVRLDTVEPALVRFPEGRLQFRCVNRKEDVASTSAASK